MGRLYHMAMLVHAGRGILDMLAPRGILALLKLAMLILPTLMLAMVLLAMVLLAMPTLEHTQDTLAGHMLLLQLLLLLPSLSEAAALP